MRILAIETVDTTGSVAALDDEVIVDELSLSRDCRSAQSLAPGIEELLRRVGWRTEDIQLVAVAVGPGSFTGLRIGVTTAKAFAYAIGCAALGVSTLEVIASRTPREISLVHVVLDAGRGEVFSADFQRLAGGELAEVRPSGLRTAKDWLDHLQPGQFVTGPALTTLASQLPGGVIAVAAEHWAPTAAAVGRIAARRYFQGQRENVFDLVPQYGRRTAAEEQWERRGKA